MKEEDLVERPTEKPGEIPTRVSSHRCGKGFLPESAGFVNSAGSREPLWPSGIAGKQKHLGSIPLRLCFLLKICGLWALFVTVSLKVNETLERLTSLSILTQNHCCGETRKETGLVRPAKHDRHTMANWWRQLV